MNSPRKHKWIASATADSHGQFREKAEREGMSTAAYAAKMKDAPGKIGKQARLARVLMHLNHNHGHNAATTEHHEEKPKVSRKERRYGKKE